MTVEITLNMKSPVLFLDFDGVLLDQADSDNYIDEFGPAFVPEKLAYIQKLQQETGCKIVVISAWRNRSEGGQAAMQRMVAERELDFVIHDTVLTADHPLSKNLYNRSSLIDYWISKNNSETIGHIVILDDSMRDGFFLPHHYNVHIQPHWTGMTEENYFMARKILLNGPDNGLINSPAPIAGNPSPSI